MTPDWLLIAGDLVPTGGMDAALLGLARHLARHSRLDIVAHRIAPELAPLVRFHAVPRPAGKHLLGAPLLAWEGWRWCKQLRRRGARIVCNGGNCPGDDINWVHYVHAAFPPRTSLTGWRRWKQHSLHRFNCWAERRVLQQSRVVICNSRRTRDDVLSLGVAADRVRVVYYGCDPERFSRVDPAERQAARADLDQSQQDRPWCVYIGSLGDVRKGFDTLYAAWKQLVQQQRWDALLWIVGRGAEQPLWAERAKADGLTQSMRFLGFRDDVPRILAACDLLLHPARYEAYGLGVQEALCRGLPAIVSRSAGVAERFPPNLQELLLNNPDDVAELVDRLRHWRNTMNSWPDRLAPFADELRSRTWDHMAADFVEASR